MKNWTLDQLKSELKQNKAIKAWVITEENVHRRERYFMHDGSQLITDQDRNVHMQSLQLKLFTELGKPGRQGEISKKLFLSLPLRDQINSAVESASQTDQQAWSLPTSFLTGDLPRIKTVDPKMAEDLEGCMAQLSTEVQAAVSKKRDTTFNSAELFLSVHDTELHLSNGLVHRSSQSRIYAEAAYSFKKSGPDGRTVSDEYLNTRWAVTMDDIGISELFDETSDRAQHSLDVSKPKTGKYSVIVDSEVLATLFNNQISQLSSSNSYHGLPFIKPGDELIKGASIDLVTVTLDPGLEFGADSTVLSEQGCLQTPFTLVKDNKVAATSTDKRYSDYLNSPMTTVRGNVVVNPGKLSHNELTRQSSIVIEILQFSGLFADPHSGTFSSEIRLAKLYDNEKGRITYLKGGSLSGSFSENFKKVRFSKEQVKRSTFSSNAPHGEGYFGPKFALLNDVSIVG